MKGKVWFGYISTRHTVREKIVRHINVDTGKLMLDRLPAIKCLTWNDLVRDSGQYTQDARHIYEGSQRWFTPRDDDWDD